MEGLRSHHPGYTIIEIMIVAAIIGATIIIVPPLAKQMNRNGLVHAVELLRADLQLARMMAIRQKKTSMITFFSDNPHHYIRSLDKHSVPLANFRGDVRFLRTGPDGKKMSDAIGFNRQGMSVSVVPGNVFLTNRSKTRIFRIRVMIAGGISVFEWIDNKWR